MPVTETAGHFPPSKPGIVRSLYDPTAGTGGMLSVAEEHLSGQNPDARLVMYGQELNGESYAICKADMLIKGQDISKIIHGNTLSDDGLPGEHFDYMLSNPPFGVEWKKIQKEITKEHKQDGFNGRFGPGLPRVSDGSLLFLMHLISKMRPAKDGGSRFGIVLNGSPLFTGKGRDIREAFKGDEYQILLVANKFQTGFDQPLLCGMYVDKRLDGIQAVQTLSRLNRCSPGKDDTYVLDFVNAPEEILASFKVYFTTASLSDVTDPNLILDLRSKLDATGYYDDFEAERVVNVEPNPKSKQSQLEAAIKPVAERLLKQYENAKADFNLAKQNNDDETAKAAKESLYFISDITNVPGKKIIPVSPKPYNLTLIATAIALIGAILFALHLIAIQEAVNATRLTGENPQNTQFPWVTHLFGRDQFMVQVPDSWQKTDSETFLDSGSIVPEDAESIVLEDAQSQSWLRLSLLVVPKTIDPNTNTLEELVQEIMKSLKDRDELGEIRFSQVGPFKAADTIFTTVTNSKDSANELKLTVQCRFLDFGGTWVMVFLRAKQDHYLKHQALFWQIRDSINVAPKGGTKPAENPVHRN